MLYDEPSNPSNPASREGLLEERKKPIRSQPAITPPPPPAIPRMRGRHQLTAACHTAAAAAACHRADASRRRRLPSRGREPPPPRGREPSPPQAARRGRTPWSRDDSRNLSRGAPAFQVSIDTILLTASRMMHMKCFYVLSTKVRQRCLVSYMNCILQAA